MEIYEILLIGIGLAMDAFAVSICKGLSMKKMNWKNAIIIALYFGVFQALMPLIGYFLGMTFESIVTTFDHWVAFALLTLIGGGMVVLAIATSIDALAIGITFAFFDVNIVLAVSIIGIITVIISVLGVKIGNRFGDKYQNKAQLMGGIILVLLGFKILLEHLEIISF